ncbi:hypothetical protein D3C76_1521780 [compost metagenome]
MAFQKMPGTTQQFEVQRRWASERQRQAMAGQREALGETCQSRAKGAADTDPVVRGAFEKIHGVSIHCQQLRHQRPAQAEPCAIQRRSRSHDLSPSVVIPSPPTRSGREWLKGASILGLAHAREQLGGHFFAV